MLDHPLFGALIALILSLPWWQHARFILATTWVCLGLIVIFGELLPNALIQLCRRFFKPLPTNSLHVGAPHHD